jgi:AcrR family transcriptional regulator
MASNNLSEETKSRQEQKAHILEAAMQVVTRDGFEGATTRKIADEAGVNIAMLNYYFGGKEALLSEMLTFAARRTLGIVRESLQYTGTVAEVLEAGFASLWNAIYHHPEFLPYSLVLRSSYDPSARQMSQELYRDYRELILDHMNRTLSHSGETLTVPVEHFAQIIVSAYNGIMLDYTVSQDKVACEQQQQTLLQMLLTMVQK